MGITGKHLLARLETVRRTCSGQTREQHEPDWADDVHLATSHRGETPGRQAVQQALATDFAGLSLAYLAFNNQIPRSAGERAAVSVHFHGRGSRRAAANQMALFGGVIGEAS